MLELKDLQESRNVVAEKIRSKAKEFDANKKAWATDADSSDWDKLNADYDGLTEQINHAAAPRIIDDRLNRIDEIQKATLGNGTIGREDSIGGVQGHRRIGGDIVDQNNAQTFRNLSTGGDVRALRSNERINRAADDGCAVGHLIHALVTGEPMADRIGPMNSLIGGTDDAGGYILNPTLSGTVIDLARSASVAMQAGATTLPMDSREMHIARLSQDPTAQWRAEGAEVLGSTLGFDRVTLRAKTLAAIVPVTLELLEDASNVGTIINQALQSALGLALDRAILFGDGSEENPRGIRNADGTNTITAIGTPTDYSQITSAVGGILGANYPGMVSGLSWITNPRDGEQFDGLTDTTGQPLNPTPWARDLSRFSTTSLPVDEGGGNNESVSIVGDFSQVLVGMRTRGVVIRVMDQGSVSDGTITHNASSELKKLIVAHLRCDVALLRPNWMTVLSGITA